MSNQHPRLAAQPLSSSHVRMLWSRAPVSSRLRLRRVAPDTQVDLHRQCDFGGQTHLVDRLGRQTLDLSAREARTLMGAVMFSTARRWVVWLPTDCMRLLARWRASVSSPRRVARRIA